jgi:hypothetical protein
MKKGERLFLVQVEAMGAIHGALLVPAPSPEEAMKKAEDMADEFATWSRPKVQGKVTARRCMPTGPTPPTKITYVEGPNFTDVSSRPPKK